MLYGNDKLNFITNYPGDPQFEYRGFLFNYWDITDALYEQYKEETQDQITDLETTFIDETPESIGESRIDEYIKYHIADYLEELLDETYIDIDYIYENSPYNFEVLKDSLYDQSIDQDDEPHYPTDAETLEHYSGICFVPDDFC